jgi:phospholipid-binding lipoprotein MlaA
MGQMNSIAVSRLVAASILATGVFGLGACATPPTDPAARAEFEKTNDPFEPANREILDFNLFIDRVALKPVAQGYVAVLPEVVRTGIRHFLDNLGEPIVFANNLLQGQFDRAGQTFGRFLTNSTFGLAGVMDPASKQGLEKQSGDFGQTLYSWGVPDGPYIVIPILGPSDVRDGIGMGVDGYAEPWDRLAWNYHYWYLTLVHAGVDGIDQRARNLDTFDELQRNAIDFYAELRSLWRQHRASELRHGEPAPLPDLDTLYQDPAPPPARPQPAQTAKK